MDVMDWITVLMVSGTITLGIFAIVLYLMSI